MTVLKDETKLVKESEDSFVYSSVFEKRLTRQEVDKFKATLQNNITTLSEQLKNFSVGVEIKKEERKLLIDLGIKKEALKNFDSYISDSILDIKKNKQETRKQISVFINNFDNFKKMKLDKLRNNLEQMKKNYEFQLKNDTEQIQIYKEA